jgi:hypothetical protein
MTDTLAIRAAATRRHRTVAAVLERRLAADLPMPTSRQLGRILGISFPTAAKHIKRVREEHARKCRETLHRSVVATPDPKRTAGCQ